MYKFVLADDHAIVRAGLKSLLENQPDIQVVAEAKDGNELLECLKTHACDMVIMDLSMPQLDGIQALKIIHELYPDLKVLVLTMQNDEVHFSCAMAAGASGYILKEDVYDQLILAARIVLNGKRYIAPSIATVIAEKTVKAADASEGSSVAVLTAREQEVIKLIAQGKANKNVATDLNISMRTVEAHRWKIMRKLGLKNTAALVRYCLSKGLI